MGRQLSQIIESLGTVTSGTINADVDVDLSTVNTKVTAIEADTAAMDSNLASLTTDVANGIIVTNATAVVTSGTVVVTTGTVTVNPVRGTTTTGTLTAGTTNGTLFATNSTRNYLLVQCTSGTAFIDTNGTATAANGIQLTSGQGITFEGGFVPTGAIAGITSTGTAQLIGRQG